MNKKIVFVFLLVASLLIATTSGSLAKKSEEPLGEIIDFVTAGGGSVHVVPTVDLQPLNFADFPELFELGVATWDNDVIDTEKVAGGINGAGVYVAVLDTGLAANWRDYFPEERIATELGRGFVDSGVMREEKTGVYEANVVESSQLHRRTPPRHACIQHCDWLQFLRYPSSWSCSWRNDHTCQGISDLQWHQR